MSYLDEESYEERSLSEYISTFRRRKLFVVITAVGVVTVALGCAWLLPPTFRSTATILIEKPEVPSNLVQSTVTQNDDDELRSIQARVMTTQNLMGVIDKLSLFHSERSTVPATILANRLRGSTGLSLVSSQATNGNGSPTAIAFTLTFDARYPALAQEVDNEIVTLYLSENARSRQLQAQGTVGFLAGEGQQLADQVKKLAAELADFKTKNAGMLPEEFQVNLQLLDRAEQQQSQLMSAIESSRERQVSLQSQLSGIDPNTPIAMPNGQPILSGESLRLQYLALSAKFGENHPAVVAARHQMEAMGVDPSALVSRAALEQQRATLKKQLDAAKKKLGESNPQIQNLTRELDAVTAQIASLPKSTSERRVGATNPIYIQLQAQLAAETTNMQALTSQETDMQKRIDDLSAQVAKSPSVERDYDDLKRTYDNAVAQYQDVASKQMDAQLAESLESERKGEKFSVIEPPDLPISPVAPNRKLIAMAGVFFAALLSLGGAIVLDKVSGRIYGARRLAKTFGYRPIIVVPDFARRARDQRNSLWRRAQPTLAKIRTRFKVGSRRARAM